MEKKVVDRVPVTKNGLQQMRDELDKMKRIDRPKIVKAIAAARALGDLKENAEYHAAKEQQGILEAKINKLADQISRSQVIDTANLENDGKAVFGCKVVLENQEDGKQLTFTIVGEFEADVNAGKLSVTSPIARAVIGKYVEDIVLVSTPSGPVEYELLSVNYNN